MDTSFNKAIITIINPKEQKILTTWNFIVFLSFWFSSVEWLSEEWQHTYHIRLRGL